MNYIFPNKKLIRILQQNQEDQTIEQSAQRILNVCGIDIEVHGKMHENLTGTLIVLDHSSGLDVFVLYAILPAQKLYFLGAYVNRMLGSMWEERLLPIFFSFHPIEEPFDIIRQYFWVKHEKCENREDAHIRNRESITKAAQLLRDEKHVILFPSGKGAQKVHQWQKGIGHLIKQSELAEISIVFIYISGSRIRNTIRQYFPRFLLSKMKKSKVIVHIEPAQIISKNEMALSPKELTDFLHNKYHAILKTKVEK